MGSQSYAKSGWTRLWFRDKKMVVAKMSYSSKSCWIPSVVNPTTNGQIGWNFDHKRLGRNDEEFGLIIWALTLAFSSCHTRNTNNDDHWHTDERQLSLWRYQPFKLFLVHQCSRPTLSNDGKCGGRGGRGGSQLKHWSWCKIHHY